MQEHHITSNITLIKKPKENWIEEFHGAAFVI